MPRDLTQEKSQHALRIIIVMPLSSIQNLLKIGLNT